MNPREDGIKLSLERYGYTYELLLAKGNFSRVFQVRESKDGWQYAVKMIQIKHGDTAKYSKRELELITRDKLSQENIVKYYHFWSMTVGNDVFLCIQMELCRVSLEMFVYNNEMGGVEIIKAEGPPRFYEQVFPQILKGLDAIHSLGWIHRDINVSNILIANPKPREIREIIIKISDFGFARKITRDEEFNNVTTLSVAPEGKLFKAPDLFNEYYDSKVDLYSAGIVLYFLSRYLEDKTQWTEEILELKKGNRGLQHLYHQDDIKLSHLFLCLMKQNPTERPTAGEALQLIQSQEVPTKFLIKKFGEAYWRRCFSDKPTLSSLKAAVETCTRINAETQVLCQEKIFGDSEERITIKIESDQDVQCMFHEAKQQKARVLIIVSVQDISQKYRMVSDAMDVL